MQKIEFKNFPDLTTPLSANNLNQLQTNVENVFNGATPMGNIKVDSISSKNLFNIKNLSFEAMAGTANINYNTGVITITDNWHKTGQTLQQLCPNMTAGKTYILTFSKAPDTNINYIYLYGSDSTWSNGDAITITQEMLNGKISIYGSQETPSSTTYTISNFQIEEGTTATSYAPFQNYITDYSYGTFIPDIRGETTHGTATYNIQEGQYVKIGKILFYNFRIGCTLTGSSGIITVGGLPSQFIYDVKEASVSYIMSTLNVIDARIYGQRLLLGTGHLGNFEDENWSSTNYIYGTGFIMLG